MASTAIAFALALATQDPAPTAQAAPAPRVHPQTTAEFFRSADTDGDGRVSLAEWRADAWRVHQAQWSGGGADRIPVANIPPTLCPTLDPRCLYGAKLYVLTLDRNHDGFIDRHESDLNAEILFRSNDLNHDGYVTPQEMDAVASKPSPK